MLEACVPLFRGVAEEEFGGLGDVFVAAAARRTEPHLLSEALI